MAQGTITPGLILIGGSAGSLDALLTIITYMAPTFRLPVVIVVHRNTTQDTMLPGLLATKTILPVKEIEEKEKIENGTIYIAPGDYHLLFEQDGTFSLDDSEKVNYSRPSIDVSFQSAADIYGPALVCILLSGANNDGTEGCLYALEKGSLTIAQSPESAEVAFMVEHAIKQNVINLVMEPKEIAAYLNGLSL
jgi:two-component system, chemotaxis family, protein-glutamate methylesterase/glutaminase